MPYYKTSVYAGKTIEVHNSYTKITGKIPKSGKEKLTPEDIEKINQINAETKLRRLINNNFKEGDFHIILTYARENRCSPDEAKKNIRKLLTNMRNEYKKAGNELKYIQVTEYKNKAIHHHLVINDVSGWNILKMVNKFWEHGRPKSVSLDNTGQYKDLASYLIKETSETYKEHKEKDEGQKQRYSCSKNLNHPVEKIKKIKANRWNPNPQPARGYYIDQDTVVNGINRWTGRAYQKYTMVQITERGKP